MGVDCFFVFIFLGCGLLIFFLIVDLIFDFLSSFFDFFNLCIISFVCFCWFILSELILFSAFFSCLFGLILFLTLEFSTIYFMPLNYLFFCTSWGFIIYFGFIDLCSLFGNTIFLFVSGLFCNTLIFCFYSSYFFFSLCSMLIFWFLGFIFLWNQLWEFVMLTLTSSCSVFGTVLFCIDILHFSHVSLGLFLFLIMGFKLFCSFNSDFRLSLFFFSVLYWHFVDIVWFFLLSFVYFDILNFWI